MAKRKTVRAKVKNGISEREVRDVEELSTPRTPVIYEVVRRLGEEEMARPADGSGGSIPAQSQMPRSHAGPEFRPPDAARTVRLYCHVAKRRDKQTLVSQACGLAELLVRPGKEADDISLGRLR